MYYYYFVVIHLTGYVKLRIAKANSFNRPKTMTGATAMELGAVQPGEVVAEANPPSGPSLKRNNQICEADQQLSASRSDSWNCYDVQSVFSKVIGLEHSSRYRFVGIAGACTLPWLGILVEFSSCP